MKKIVATILVLSITLLSLISCGIITGNQGNGNNGPSEDVKLRIGYLAGPTGMGMAKLIVDNGGPDSDNDKYVFKKYEDSGKAKSELAAGKIDIICLPTNEAAVFYNTVDDSIRVLAINCLNSLYLLTSGETTVQSLSDLEGQTVYTCKNGTPRAVLSYVVKELGLDITISHEINGKEILTPNDLSTCVVTGAIPNAVMPEPLVTSSLLTIAKNGDESINYTVDVDLGDEWSKISDTSISMGCIVASGSVINGHKDLVDQFLTEYKASVEFIGNPDNLSSAADYIVKTNVMGAAPAATKALKNLGEAISYVEGEDMKNTLIAFYNAIGVAIPSNDFYYEK